MKLLKLPSSASLSDLSYAVGDQNLSYVLNANGLSRSPNIGQVLSDSQSQTYLDDEVEWTNKINILNNCVPDSDIFEAVATGSENTWKCMSKSKSIPGYISIPDTIEIADTEDTLGNGIPIKDEIYKKAISQLSSESTGHKINPAIFNELSNIKASYIATYSPSSNSNLYQAFRIPWGDVILHSSLDNSQIEFPVYPEEMSDGVKANYSTMPDLLYQYEPWQLYTGSGPRSNQYTFKIHRDMWSGDHRDGKANELIRFCEACCYPEYNGSAVNTSTVTLIIAGKPLIRGVMTDVSTTWSGPIGLDGYYLQCELQISITEVSDKPLNYSYVKSRDIIGGQR